MLNFDFKKSSRKCFQSEREFQPGDNFYSVLVECDDGSAERRDFSSDHWDGPPEDCIGWWKCSVPELGKGRVYWAPKKVLLAYFEHVLANSQTADIAFVMGLLLVQRKVLTLADEGGDEANMELFCRSSKANYSLPVVEVSHQRLNEIQNELSDRLFMDQPATDDDADGESESPDE